MIAEEKEGFTKYEVARILGARALQIAMDAPLLLKISKEKLEEVRYDPLRISEIEFKSNVLPISVRRPFPKKSEADLRREKEEAKKKHEEEKREKEEEKEIRESGEIMEAATPEDEVSEETTQKAETEGAEEERESV